ncbi:MAG: AzlD domain-containing protein [Negativicutes bacterium]|nr:AzlD domain-containing protein [Negativicutes bacterium]
MRFEMVAIIAGMAAATFLTRFGAQALFRRIGLPPWFDRWLKHVPTGILTALIVPPLLLPRGHLDLTTGNDYLLAGLLAALVAYRFRNTALTMVLGLTTVILLRWIGSGY